jgi:hypothetical protein
MELLCDREIKGEFGNAGRERVDKTQKRQRIFIYHY